MTNGEFIRSLNDEDLAAFMFACRYHAPDCEEVIKKCRECWRDTFKQRDCWRDWIKMDKKIMLHLWEKWLHKELRGEDFSSEYADWLERMMAKYD